MNLTSSGNRCFCQQVTFDWKREARGNNYFTKKQEIGFVAQEIEEVFPELVQRYGFRCVITSGRSILVVGNVETHCRISVSYTHLTLPTICSV